MSGLDLRNALGFTAIAMVAGLAATYSGAGRATFESDGPAASAVATSPSQSGGSVCYHITTSDYVCPDSMFVQSIAQVSVTVTNKSGQRRTITLPPGVDAIMLTRQATEKFLLSYYWAADREKAERLYKKLQAFN